jgi:ABC-type Fe3+-hydroxamate transport system substrate-binding protein
VHRPFRFDLAFRPACALVLSALVLACVDRPPSATGSERDDFGDIVAPGSSETPARIVSLNPTSTELLFAIGAGARIVGRTQWDVWPDEARSIPDVGPGLRPNVEAVLARRPDLVVLYASEDNRSATAQLQAAGVRTIALKIDSIGSFVRGARLLGLATGRSAEAGLVVDSVTRTLDRVRAATANLERPSVFWHVWDSPIITIGAGSYMSELVDIAGGRNVYADLPEPSASVALEDIVRRDPAIVLAGPDGARVMRESAAWNALPAVRAGRIAIVDTTLVGRPSVHLGEAAVSLARLLHPELRF